ncbi:TonB-dependent receptor [Croceicoccus estronivorus]|uniref:TonB-dependent receptor n=1 Tax=Croceicoccus estronivorus TaxID=1172626 RepID=UPI00083425D0|nr:TonB-dependent siderophore receptor [Croceicoccus estronivorus]OCC24166.1 TonB-dependent receptor [Croceicoccus estronivorus]
MSQVRKRGSQSAANFIAMGCVGFVASFSGTAVAQENSGQAVRLEGVTVTDTAIEDAYKVERVQSPKATAPLLDTPRTVSVITNEVLQDSASFSFEDALRTVPGITLGAGEGGVASADIPLIRGVDGTGSVFVNGARDIGSQQRETFAVEQIEVFKGPNSALGGRGTAAGAINIVSKVARQGNFATAQVTGGTSDLIRITGDVNAEIAENLSVRVVGMYHDADVAGRDSVYDDRWGISPSITWGAGTPVSASFNYYHYETDSMPDYGIPLTSRNQLPGGVREPADVDYDNFYGLLDRDFKKTKIDSGEFLFSAELGSGLTLSNTTRYSSTRNNYIVTNPDDSAGNVANGYVWRNTKSRNSTNKSWISNTNLAAEFETGSIKHSSSIGFEYGHSKSRNRNYSVDTGNYRFGTGDDCATAGLADFNCTDLYNPDPSDPWVGTITPSASPSTAKAEEFSIYAFDTITIVPQLLVNGGVRWTKFSAEGAGCGRSCYSAKNKSDFWSWQGGIIYKPSENSSIYFSYADSKTPPGTTVGEGSENIGNDNDAFYKPQTTENWEIGAKVELFEGQLRLEGALYRVNRSNIISTDDDVVTDTFDKARIQGFELGATGQVGPVSMMIGYTYVDSKLSDDPNSSTDYPGNRLPNAPVHNFASTVNVQVTPKLSIGGGAYAASKRYADGANLIKADGYVRFDANAAYDINDHFSVRLNVQNIGDKRYITKLRNPHFAQPAAGRQAMLTLTARY